MPARRKTDRYSKINPKRKVIKTLLFPVLTVILFILAIYIFKPRFYDPKGKLNISVNEVGGNVSILIFDVPNSVITRIVIPGETMVETAGNLGNLMLKNIWKLGVNEGLGGAFLSRTVTKYFKFPNYIWSESQGLGFSSSNPIQCIKSAVLPYKTNLSTGDKLFLGIFCLKVKNVDRNEINLSETSFIRKQKLTDGNDGYVLTGVSSPKLYSNFNNEIFSKGDVKVSIKDGTEDSDSAKTVGEIVEIMGGKTAAIIKGETGVILCQVRSKNIKIAEEISLLFGCSILKEEFQSNFNAEVLLGKEFSKYY